MSTIVTRAGKGSPLTNTELDSNFTNLNTDKLEKSGSNTADKIAFNLTAALTPLQGELTWDASTGTLDIGLNDGSTVLSIGEDQIYRVINKTGASIPKGTLVMSFGTVGNSGAIKIKAWDGTQASKTILGLTAAAIPAEALPGVDGLGYVLAFGKIRGIQTNGANYSETWVDGDIIYARASGGLTKTIPAAPNTKTTVAIVIAAHASNGTMFVRPTYGSNLGEDELVQLTSLANNDVLQYNSTTVRFENKTREAAGLITTAGAQTRTTGLLDLQDSSFAGQLRISRTGGANYSVIQYYSNGVEVGKAGFTGSGEFLIRNGTSAADNWVITNGSLTTGSVPWARLTSVPTTLAGYGVTALQVAASTVKAVSDTFNQTGIVYSDIALFGQTDGAMYANAYSSLWQHQIYGDYRTGQIAVRGKNNNVWQSWRTVLDSSNFNTYAPTLTGTGASGSWGISVTGNAATATALQTARTIGGVSFNGTADISLPGVNTAGNQNTTGTAANVTGTVAAANGGTGNASYAIGDILYASGATALSRLADVATGNALISGGVGVAPAWGKVGLTTHVSGTLAAGNGGTGNAFFAVSGPATSVKTYTLPNATSTILTTNAAVTVAQGGTGRATLTANNVILGNGTTAVAFVAPGTAGNALVSNGTTWVSGAAGFSRHEAYFFASF
jgi:hypothetical protein